MKVGPPPLLLSRPGCNHVCIKAAHILGHSQVRDTAVWQWLALRQWAQVDVRVFVGFVVVGQEWVGRNPVRSHAHTHARASRVTDQLRIVKGGVCVRMVVCLGAYRFRFGCALISCTRCSQTSCPPKACLSAAWVWIAWRSTCLCCGLIRCGGVRHMCAGVCVCEACRRAHGLVRREKRNSVRLTSTDCAAASSCKRVEMGGYT